MPIKNLHHQEFLVMPTVILRWIWINAEFDFVIRQFVHEGAIVPLLLSLQSAHPWTSLVSEINQKKMC